MKILGIDPGTVVTGFGIIHLDETRAFRPIDYGCIRPPRALPLAKRYEIIYKGIEELLRHHQPDAMAIETQYILPKNPQSGMKLAVARGIIVLAATLNNLGVFEYTPSQIKKAVVGRGNASKAQIQGMLKNLLSLNSPPTPEDAADALGLAICHGNACRFGKRTAYQKL